MAAVQATDAARMAPEMATSVAATIFVSRFTCA